MEQKYRVIVADDEEPEVRALEKIIQENLPGLYLLPSARNGLELVELARELSPDILICDINMPGLGGLEALEQLRRSGVQGKIIINTAYPEFEFARKALLLGASDYLLKPTEPKDFLARIRQLIHLLDEERGQTQVADVPSRSRQAKVAYEVALFPLGVTKEEAFHLLEALKEHDRERALLVLEGIYGGYENLPDLERWFLCMGLLQWCAQERVRTPVYSWQEVRDRLQGEEKREASRMALILWGLLERIFLLEDTGKKMEYVKSALIYIQEHFAENISLEDAAAGQGISPFYLSRLLTQTLQASFVELLTAARLEAAINLIRRGVPLRKDIETRVGFSSPTYFYKVLKKNTGMTAGEIRDFAGRMGQSDAG